MNIRQNNLISNFHNYNQQLNNQYPDFQNNPLLQLNNQKNKKIDSSLLKHIENLKKAQELKTLQKVNEIERIFDKNTIIKSVIKPLEITKPNKGEIISEYKKQEQNYSNNLRELWKKRTNQPYKNILKNENYNKDFKKKEDLIVHKVTDQDKNKDKLDTDYKSKEKDLEKHNNELKSIYTLSKEIEHKQKFKYENKSKFKVKYDPKDYDELKKDQIEFYKKEQKKLDKDKKKVDDIIEYSISSGLLSPDEINKLEEESNKTILVDKSIDDLLLNDGDIIIEDKVEDKEEPDNLKNKYLNRKKNSENTGSETNINTDLKEKYKARQKK
jgi:hypothetical protein